MLEKKSTDPIDWLTADLAGIPLNLSILKAGQSFRWNQAVEDNSWIGVVKRRVWQLKLEDTTLMYRCIAKSEDQGESDLSLIEEYLQLNVNLAQLYSTWSDVDDYTCNMCAKFPGIRVLRQDPTECLFSFICSSNNNITRISGMVGKLCQTYGKQIDPDSDFYAFPSVEKLAENPVELESNLRRLGFGYRAKYIAQTAQQIVALGGTDWLESLRKIPYEEAKKALMALSGVGAKVADCVCLMSLDKPESVPIDTHIWQITQKHFKSGIKGKTKNLTDKLYTEIGDFYREKFGLYAGWASTVMFTGDLRGSIGASLSVGFSIDQPEKVLVQRKRKKVLN